MLEPLQIGDIYMFKSGDEGKECKFTVLAHHVGDDYTVYTHDDAKQEEWNLHYFYDCITKLT